MSLKELKTSKSKIDDINTTASTSTKLSFEQKYKRMTNYVEHDVFHQIMVLKDENRIRTIKDFVNEALKKALKEMNGNDNFL